MKYYKHNDGVLSHQSTSAINGIFAIMIFISHISGYLTLDDLLLDNLYEKFQNFHGQLVVTTFLAFSGYGVMTQLLKRGKKYVDEMPVKRILKVLIHFDIAILLYLLVNFIFHREYSMFNIIFSFTGWTSVGNSNWYIFAILAMYLITYISAKLSKNNHKYTCIFSTIGCFLYVFLMYYVGKPERFFSTALCYVLGLWIAYYKDAILRIFSKQWLLSLLSLILLFVLTYKDRENALIMNLHSVIFVTGIVCFTTRIHIGNKFLDFFGKHAFSIYIIQRIPMIVMSSMGLLEYISNEAFVVIAFILTMILACVFDKLLEKFDQYIFNPLFVR